MSSSSSNRPSPSLPVSTERLLLSTEEPLSPVSSSFSFCSDSPLQRLRPKSHIVDDDTKEISHELLIDHPDTAKDTWVQVMDASSEHVQQSDMEEEATSQDGSDINVEEYVMVPSEPQFTNKCWDNETLSPSTSASDGSWGDHKVKEQDLFLMGTPSSTTSSTSQYRESKEQDLMMKDDEKQPDEEGEEEARSEAASENYDSWEEHPMGGNKKQEAENDDFRDAAAPYPPPLSFNRLVVIPPYVKATLQGDSAKALVARSRQRVYKAELFKDIYVVHMSVMQLNGRLDSAPFPGVATNPQAFVSVIFVDWSRDNSATSTAYACETLRSAMTLFELLFSQLAGYDPSDIKSKDKEDWSHPERFEVTSCEYTDESIEMMREEFISVLVNKCLRRGLPVPDRERLFAAASISEYQEDMAMSFLE